MFTMLLRNIKSSLYAQISSVLVSICMGLVVPKFLSVQDYAYWQIFIIYCACFELLLFGIPNGFFIKNAGTVVKQYSYLKTSFVILLIINIIISLIIYIVTEPSNEEAFINYFLMIALVVMNSGIFFSLITRSNNEVPYDCYATTVTNLIIVIGVFLLLYNGVNKVKWIISIYIAAFLVRDILLFIKNKELLIAKIQLGNIFLKSLTSDFFVGSKILLIDYTNLVAFAICRILCKNEIGIVDFGMFSFALSLVILVINFVNQISLSVLPSLRQLDEKSIKTSYVKIRNFTSVLFVLLLLAYKPVITFISIWVPKYSDSLTYIVLLFPLIVCDGKMQTVFNLYLKLLRKEDILFKTNILYILFSSIFYYLILSCSSNAYYLIFSILILSYIRSTILEVYISKYINTINFKRKILLETFIVITYLIINTFSNGTNAWIFLIIITFLSDAYNMKKCGVQILDA